MFILSFMLLSNAKSVSADVWFGGSGCAVGNNYSITTGKPCGSWLVVDNGCAPGNLFSSTTGQSCSGVNTSQDNIYTKNNIVILSNLEKELIVGSKGEEVKAVQQFLKDGGFLFGKVDGSYGPITKRALIKYQIQNNLKTTGKVDQITIEKIKAEFSKLKLVQAPIISRVDGPQETQEQILLINATGTWKVVASDPNGKTLSYSVVWGDNVSTLPETNDSGVFTHKYSEWKTYTPIFTATNGEQSTQYQLNVKVVPGV